MDNQDDPEARIREYERRLSDSARASEQAAQPYANPPQPGGHGEPFGPSPSPGSSGPPFGPSPGSYGTTFPTGPLPGSYGHPFGTTPPRKAGGSRVWWIVGAFLAIVIILPAVGAFFVYRATRSFSNSPSTSAIGGPNASASATGEPTPAPASGAGALPAFQPPADLGANCTYPASPDPAAKKVGPPRTGRVPTDPKQVSMSMTTNQGNIGLQLDNGKSPCTVNSFVSLAQKGFYDNTPCHRLTNGPGLFVLQCGDPTGTGSGGPGYQFANEYPTNQYKPDDAAAQQPVTYPRGTLAMANAGPGTNGSQFFMIYKDSQLPPQYAVFGMVDQTGLATLDKIAAAGVADGGQDGKPATDVKITSMRLD